MAKRKAAVSDDESAVLSEDESEAVATESESDAPRRKSKGKAKAPKAKVPSIKKPKYKKSESEDDESEESEVEQPITKRPKREEKKKVSASSASGSVEVLKNLEGDKYVDLGKKKHATVRAFKGVKLVDIREFYDAGGVSRPGKKGISLTLDQWNTLRAASDTIDQLLEDLKAT
ncbi:hypothetical protein MD484_g7272, partial [Candolleomyces efflorescens]